MEDSDIASDRHPRPGVRYQLFEYLIRRYERKVEKLHEQAEEATVRGDAKSATKRCKDAVKSQYYINSINMMREIAKKTEYR